MSKIISIRFSSQHPKEMLWLAFIEMCQRFAFWGIGSLLVFYLVQHFGMEDAKATHIYGVFSGVSFVLPLVGGYLADRTSHFKGVILGCLFTIIGALWMATCHQTTLFFALMFTALGAGLFTPSVYAILGRIYHEKHHLREGGFSIYYAAVNIGVFLATISMGALGHSGYWSLAFILAAFVQFLGLLAFLKLKRRAGFYKTHIMVSQSSEKTSLSKIDRDRILLIIILSVLSIVFWMAYNQGWSSMSLFILKYTDRHLGVYEFSPSWILSTESLFLILLAYPLAKIYSHLAKIKKDPSPISKMFLSFLFMGACFFILGVGGGHLSPIKPLQQASPIYSVAGYFFMALAEMLLAPIGLSLVTHLSPHRYTAFLVGFWYVCVGIAYYLGGSLAGIMNEFSTLRGFFDLFMIACLGLALLIILFEKLLSRLRHMN